MPMTPCRRISPTSSTRLAEAIISRHTSNPRLPTSSPFGNEEALASARYLAHGARAHTRPEAGGQQLSVIE